MTTTHRRQYIAATAPGRWLGVITVLGAALILGFTGIRAVFGSDGAAFPPSRTLTPTHSRPVPAGPPMSSGRPAHSGVDRNADDSRFLALVADAANRDGYPAGDRENAIAAAHVVCVRVGDGQTLTDAAASLMIDYGFTGRQASGVGRAALKVYCPEYTPWR